MKSALKVFGIIALVTIIGFSFAACGDGGGGGGSGGSGGGGEGGGTTTVVSVTGVTLNKSATTMLIGNKETLTATVTPANAANKTVTWSTSNAGVATVAGGEITAVAKGSTVITVTTADGGKTATCNVTVSDTAVAVTGVSLNKSSMSITIGGTELLTVTFTPTGATNQNVTWSSSNTTVATVSNGTITAKAAGTATITVTTADGNKTATCTVTVNNRTLSGNINFPDVGFTTGMTLIATYSGSETVSFQWQKDGVNVGTASATNPNKFTPTVAGNYTVTVSAEGYNSKTSQTNEVTQLSAGYVRMYYGVVNSSQLDQLKAGNQSGFDRYIETLEIIEPDKINKSTPADVTYQGTGYWILLVPKSLGLVIIKNTIGTDVTANYPPVTVSFNGVEYYLHCSSNSTNQNDLKLNLSYSN